MAKKQMIMDNALELFAKQGFEATSIQQITDKCGISKGAFYLSFKSKDELISSLLDQFLEELFSKFEHLVTNSPDDSQLLFQYCYLSFENVKKNISLAQIFIKEASTTFNVDICKRLESFYMIMTQILQTIIERQFPNVEQHIQSELVFTVHTLVKGYTELIFRPNKHFDVQLISRSIEEKVTILANHMTISTIQSVEQLDFSVSTEQLLKILDEKAQSITSPIILESLQLLRDHIEQPTLNNAVVHGLLNNLYKDMHTKHIAYMYEMYIEA